MDNKQSRTRKVDPNKSVNPCQIGFRLDEASAKQIVARAKRMGVSRHEVAREYIRQMLSEPEDRTEMNRCIALMQKTIKELRIDFALAIEAILVSAGKVDAKQARAWINENLRGTES
jgi:Ribbon-helix-helix protein, copG family